jgi:hypothetical protein
LQSIRKRAIVLQQVGTSAGFLRESHHTSPGPQVNNGGRAQKPEAQ